MIGVKYDTETEDVYFLRNNYAVGEFSHRDEGEGATHTGALRSKNVGTSNHNGSEILPQRKTKVSLAMKISQGLVGPKGMANAAPDGHTVNIP